MGDITIESTHPDVFILNSGLALRATWVRVKDDQKREPGPLTSASGASTVARVMMSLNSKLGVIDDHAHVYTLVDAGELPPVFYGHGNSITPIILCDYYTAKYDVIAEFKRCSMSGVRDWTPLPKTRTEPHRRAISLAALFMPRLTGLTPESLRVVLAIVTEHLRQIPASNFLYLVKDSILELAVLYEPTGPATMALSAALEHADEYLDQARPM
ncbi:MAG: hypothetical protein WC241_05185 [Candidatus Paceibacterota bacterium]|jgi:hypothetical protein